MKSRLTLVVCCLLTTLLVGIWLGQKLPLNPAADEEVVRRSTVSPFNSDGWQLSTGQQTGPAAFLPTDSLPQRQTISDSAVQPANSVLPQTANFPSEPDIAYFPEVIVGAAREEVAEPVDPTKRLSDGDSPKSGALLTEHDAAVWKSELSDLPPEQAEEILRLRQQLGSVASESLGFSFPDFSDTEASPPGLFPALAESEARPMPIAGAFPDDKHITHVSAVEDSPVAKLLREEAERNYAANIANVRTPGYKRREIVVLNVSIDEPPNGAAKPSLSVTDTASEIAASIEHSPAPWINRLDLRQGKFISTSNPLDLAIDGPGWLQVDRNGKPEYVRAGVLGFDKNRQLGIRTGAGLLLIQPAITFPETGRRLVITESGEVFAVNNQEERQAIGMLTSYEFFNAAALKRTDVGTCIETRETVNAIASAGTSSARFLQSFLEASNVDPQQELADRDHLRSVAERIAQRVKPKMDADIRR